MELIEPPTRPRLLPGRPQILVALALGLLLFLCSGRLAGESWGADAAPYPFMWRDVVMVHFLCALPLAWLWANFIHQRLAPRAALVRAGIALAVGFLPFLAGLRPLLNGITMELPWLGTALRAIPVLGPTLAAGLVIAVRTPAVRADRQPLNWRRLAGTSALGLAVLLIAPWTYVSARCGHDLARLEEYLEHQRLGEARMLAHRLIPLDPQATCRGQSLSLVVNNLDQIVQQLEVLVAAPLPPEATAVARLLRARQLAMLGRTDDALASLAAIQDATLGAEIDSLRGTILDNRGEWNAALLAYKKARSELQALPASPAQTAGLAHVIKGAAYCERKLGNHADAENAYQELLALSPKAEAQAEAHFLLAMFYDDTEQTMKARWHAQQAMVLLPDAYEQRGMKLINKMAVYHFGCLGVFSADADVRSSSLAPPSGQ